MSGRLRAAYRSWWFYASPAKLVTRQTIRGFFQGRPACDLALELGGGTAMMRPTIERACRPLRLISSDIEPTEATGLVCDAQALPFRSGAFDLVAAFELIEHLPDTARFLSEVGRVSRPGGHVIVSAPFVFGTHDLQDYYRFTSQGLDRVLSDHGLHVVAARKSGGTWHTLVALLIEYVRNVGIPPATGWRSHGRGRQAHLAASTVLTLPLTALSWLAFALDALIDRDSRNPVGLVVIAEAQRPSARRAHPAGAGGAARQHPSDPG